eukprot:gene8579-9496_t
METESLKRAVDTILSRFFSKIESLTAQQFEILKSLFVHCKDTLAILPTGHGKSLPFQVAPFIAHGIGRPEAESKDIVIVVSPLFAIMDTQAKELNRLGITSCCLHDESLNTKALSDGKYHIVYGTPESWTQGEWWKMLHSKTYQEKILLIVADEAHCIPKWWVFSPSIYVIYICFYVLPKLD